MSLHISPEYARRSLSREAEYEARFIKYVTLEEPLRQGSVLNEKLDAVKTVPSAEMTFCSLCGTANHLTGKFCSSCGTRLGSKLASMDRRVVWLSSIAMTLVFIMSIALYSNESTRQAWGTFFGLTFFAALIAICYFAWRRILTQAGYPVWLSFLTVIPAVGGVVLLYMAFNEWPVCKRLRQLEAECASLRHSQGQAECRATDNPTQRVYEKNAL